ncbi:hypothetical protein OG21DRAFT_1499811 [Imleria badia]|nr:hypothetical protein OG21DRAFT_1499811 [Imleria badia]
MDPEDDTGPIFPRSNTIPSIKTLTFKGPFDMEALYAEPQHGILSFESAYIEQAEKADQRRKRLMTLHSLQMRQRRIAFSRQSVLRCFLSRPDLAREAHLQAADKLSRNPGPHIAPEAYIYDTRSKINDRHATRVQLTDKAKLDRLLRQAKDRLYSEEGEDATGSAYIAPSTRSKPLLAQTTSFNDKDAHVDDKDETTVLEKCATVSRWLEDQIARQAERPENEGSDLFRNSESDRNFDPSQPQPRQGGHAEQDADHPGARQQRQGPSKTDID